MHRINRGAVSRDSRTRAASRDCNYGRTAVNGILLPDAFGAENGDINFSFPANPYATVSSHSRFRFAGNLDLESLRSLPLLAHPGSRVASAEAPAR